MIGLRQWLFILVAGELGRPHGVLSRSLAILLKRGNRRSVTAAVEASRTMAGDIAANIGFGGGTAISLLLARVGEGGAVHVIEIADDMLNRARFRFSSDIGAGRLQLANGSLTALPLDDMSLDAVVTVHTLYLVDDLDAACGELARVLRPGGRAVVGIGDPDVMAQMPFTAYGFTLRAIEDVVAALERAGLTLVERQRLSEVAVAIPHNLLVARRRE